MSVVGVVLAGGRSSRFGSPKLAAELHGSTILDLTIAAVAAVTTEVIVVIAPDVPAPALPANVRIVRDLEEFGGPLVGLAAALNATEAPVAIVVGGDMPLVRPSVLDAMRVALPIPPGAAAVVLADESGPRPLPIVLGTAARLPLAVALASGEHSLRAFLNRLTVLTLAEEDWRPLDPAGDTLVDIDVPQDLERVRASDPGGRGLP